MKRVIKSILAKNPGPNGTVIVVNPVSWLPNAWTSFNERIGHAIPAVARDVEAYRNVLGSGCRGDVHLTFCLESHGFVVANVFCIGRNGLSAVDLRDGLRRLTDRMPDATYRLPESLGIRHMDNKTGAYVNDLIGPVLWLNGVATEFRLWRDSDQEVIRLTESDEFAVMARLWEDYADGGRSDKTFYTCRQLWLAFCVRNDLYEGTPAYKACLTALCDAGNGQLSLTSQLPYHGYQTVYNCMSEPVTAIMPYPYDALNVPDPADCQDDRDLLFRFIDGCNCGQRTSSRQPYTQEGNRCHSIIKALTLAYLHEHGLRRGDPACKALIDEVIDRSRTRAALRANIPNKRSYMRMMLDYAPD